MKSWPDPPLPAIAGAAQPLRMFNTSTGAVAKVTTSRPVRLYVCGITPYDATHLGHAATYVAFDLAVRALRDSGHAVNYTQNVTDIDDPLLERAARDQVRWEDLATSEIELFRKDMTALRVIPPSHYVGVVEAMPIITELVRRTLDQGAAYQLRADDGSGPDLYVDLAQVPGFGEVSGWSRAQMMAVFAERGGDPDRPGKRNPLDPLLWRAARPGEPSWSADGLPDGRPGWHVECTAIAMDRLGTPLDINGGGSDLIFPHHEMSVAGASAVGVRPYAALHAHAGMVGLDGQKMSKSRGNLVLVSALRSSGTDPMAIRLVLLAHHYRSDWDYLPAELEQAQDRLGRWRAARAGSDAAPAGSDQDEPLVDQLRTALATDLDAPAALAAVDAWIAQGRPLGGLAVDAVDALLGVKL